jgi:hypothetical protein
MTVKVSFGIVAIPCGHIWKAHMPMREMKRLNAIRALGPNVDA